MSGGNPSPISHPPKTEGGGTQPNKNCAKNRRVGNSHEHLGTRLKSDVTSATTHLAIEEVKDGDRKTNPACHSIKIEGGNGGKEKGTAPEANTTATAHSACQSVNACCKYGPTSTCKTARCGSCKDARVCVSCQCLGWCVNSVPQT